MTSPSPGLRERTRRAVRAELGEVAMRLFMTQGFEATTVHQIVAAAGISRSSFFRYFGTKEDVMLHALGDAHAQIAAALSERPAGEPPWTALRRSFDDLAEDVEHEPQKARPLVRMLFETPALHSAQARKRTEWASVIAAQLAPRLGGGDGPARLRATALTSAALSCLEVVEATWAMSDSDTSFADMLDVAMSAVAPLDPGI